MGEQIVWFNGDLIPISQVRVGVEDRGFQFADGVYEVVRVYNGRPFTLREHMQRLQRSADGLHLALPMSVDEIGAAIVNFIPIRFALFALGSLVLMAIAVRSAIAALG